MFVRDRAREMRRGWAAAVAVCFALLLGAPEASGRAPASKGPAPAPPTKPKPGAGPMTDHAWKSYANARFQYSICYPEDVLSPQGESDNADGQRFVAKDGAQLLAFGSNNAHGDKLADIMADTSARLAGEAGKVTYKALEPKWFVVSGQSGERVFYAKTMLTHGQLKSFELLYDHASSAVYEPIVARLSKCFADLAK